MTVNLEGIQNAKNKGNYCLDKYERTSPKFMHCCGKSLIHSNQAKKYLWALICPYYFFHFTVFFSGSLRADHMACQNGACCHKSQ